MKNLLRISFFALLVSACSKGIPTSGPTTVSGTVTEYGSNKPMHGAFVYLISNKGNSAGALGNTTSKVVQTNSDGTYQLSFDAQSGIGYTVVATHRSHTESNKVYIHNGEKNIANLYMAGYGAIRIKVINTFPYDTLYTFGYYSYNFYNIVKDTSFLDFATGFRNQTRQYYITKRNKMGEEHLEKKTFPVYVEVGDTIDVTLEY